MLSPIPDQRFSANECLEHSFFSEIFNSNDDLVFNFNEVANLKA